MANRKSNLDFRSHVKGMHLDFRGNQVDYLPLVDFVYNNNYQLSNMVPYEKQYMGDHKSHICVGQSWVRIICLDLKLPKRLQKDTNHQRKPQDCLGWVEKLCKPKKSTPNLTQVINFQDIQVDKDTSCSQEPLQILKIEKTSLGTR